MSQMEGTTPNLETPSLSSASIQSRQTKKLVDFVKQEFNKAKNDRWKEECQWYLNLAFYFGKQNIQTQYPNGNVSRQFRLYTPPAPYYRSRPIINKVRPLLRTEMSKLTAQRPNAFVIPSSSDERDLYAANAAEQIWDSIYREKRIHRLIRRAVFWSSITGNGFIKSWWDDEKEDVVSDIMGDICFEAITPFHFFVPDLKEVELENQAFVIHAANRDYEHLKLLYGKELKTSKDVGGDTLEESLTNVMGLTNTKKRDTVLTLEMWVKPNHCKLWPSGGMITVAGNDILAITEGMPYEHKQFPFSHLQHIETGKFYAESVITDLIPLQREYNRTRGQIIESKNRMAKPQLAAEIGSIDVTKVTSEPGQIIQYRPGFQPPLPIPLQNLPNYVLDEQDRIISDMDEIAGQHEVSRGQVPPGVTAATAISYLQEQDESKLSYTYDSLEEMIEKVAYQTLIYVKMYWDTPRKVKVTGADGSFDVLAFEGSDLRDNTDIRIEAGSALPTSRAAKQAFIMDLMKMGFIDPNKGLEVMEIGGINKIYEQIQVDVRQAQRENLKMSQATSELINQNRYDQLNQLFQEPYYQGALAQGMIMEHPDGSLMDMTPMTQGLPPEPIEIPLIVPVNTWDDHRIHIERHNNYRKSQAFDQLSPEAKKLFEDHVNGHVAAIMVGAQGAMQMPPGMLDLANNPETVKEMSSQEQETGATAQDAASSLPPVSSAPMVTPETPTSEESE